MAASSCSCTASEKEVEDKLTAYGMKLRNPPSSSDDLLNFLYRVESSLIMVSQCPSDSMKSALQPVMNALIEKEFLSHTNEDVKVLVVCCITELFRITAPHRPYDDDKQMKEILQRTIMALKKLCDVSGCSYYKVVQILETVAKVRAFVMLLDFECDTLVIEIFKLFLGIIRPYHPHNVFTKMEEIMIQLIEDSDELSVELLRPILDSVKKENQIASPVSSKLGEKVLEKCSAIVKPYLADALKSMSLNPDDCAIVASICNEMPKGEQMMANENAPDTLHAVKLGSPDADFCEPTLQDDIHMEQPKDTCTTNAMKPDTLHPVKLGSPDAEFCKPALQDGTHMEQLKDTCTTNAMKPDTLHPVKVGSPDAEFCEPAVQDDTHMEQLKDICTTNAMKPDNPEEVQSATTVEVVPRRRSELTGSGGQHSSASKKPEISKGSHGHWGQPMKKEILKNEDAHLSVYPEGDVPQSQVKRKSYLLLGLTGEERTKHMICAKRKPGRGSRKNESASNDDAESKSECSIKSDEGNISDNEEPSLQQIDGTKQKKNKTTIKMHNIEESGDKETKRSTRDENHLNKCANHKPRRKSSIGKHEDSKRHRIIKDYGEELVGTRIKVWWPVDKEFYEATISSFDPVKKRHKVVYVDGDVEILNLHEERWQMLKDNLSEKMANENAPDTVHPVKVSPSEVEFCEPALLVDTHPEQGIKRSRAIKDYGEELVGARIKVWWPVDGVFYEAAISSFNPVKKRHKVVYVDGAVERLNLSEERWKMLEDNSSQKDHAVDSQGLSVSSTEVDNVVNIKQVTPPDLN